MFFSRKTKSVRKDRLSNRTKFSRRMMLETLEERRLLTVTLLSPTPTSWVYGESESISGNVVDVSGNPPAQGTEVDLVNSGSTTGSANPILLRTVTSDSSGDFSFNLSYLNVGSYNLVAEFVDSGGTLETRAPPPPPSRSVRPRQALS